MSARAPKGEARLRAVPDPEDEPQVVRAPPDGSGGATEGQAHPGARRPGKQGARGAPGRERPTGPAGGGARGAGRGGGGGGAEGAVRAPAEGSAVRAPPDREAGRTVAPKRQQRPPERMRREPEVEIEAPGEVRMLDDDEPPARRRPPVSRSPRRVEEDEEPKARKPGAGVRHDGRSSAAERIAPDDDMDLDREEDAEVEGERASRPPRGAERRGEARDEARERADRAPGTRAGASGRDAGAVERRHQVRVEPDAEREQGAPDDEEFAAPLDLNREVSIKLDNDAEQAESEGPASDAESRGGLSAGDRSAPRERQPAAEREQPPKQQQTSKPAPGQRPEQAKSDGSGQAEPQAADQAKPDAEVDLESVPASGPAPAAPSAKLGAEAERGKPAAAGPAAVETDAAKSPAGTTSPGQGAGEEESGESDGKPAGLTPPSHRGASSNVLSDVIVAMGMATREAMDAAIAQGRESGKPVERVLLEAGALSADNLARALAERYGLDHIDISVFPVDPSAVSLVTNQAAKRYQAVPVAFVDDRKTLLVAMSDPANVISVDDIAIMTGYEVRVAVASPQDVGDLIARMDRLDAVVAEPDADFDEAELAPAGGEVVNLRENADEAPVVKLVNQIVAQAVEMGASDIHLSPTDRDLRVRFRIDGVLRDITTIPRRMAPGAISRVKIMGELDIAERRLPQDGRVGLSVDGRHVDLRIVTLPSAKGEAAIMRILDKDSAIVALEKLGMGEDDRARFEGGFMLSHGAVLVTGPTGSGKTTTLYAALTQLNTKERNIITIEDPVEYQLDGLTQVQVAPKVGLTFAVGLRTMMRADPDVIMVGEIRDQETAQIAVESALTGHLVLSTLHTNDAPSALHRLIEMDIEPFLVSSAIECVLAQRLARRLCTHCKRETVIPMDVLRASGYQVNSDLEAFEPVGCPRCGNSGYRGRIALYEVMTMSREIRDLALERRSSEEIRDTAVAQGMRRMRDDGLEKVYLGLTSIAEIARVIGSTS